MTLGPRDLSLLTLPAGWDAGELEKIRLADNTPYSEVAAMVNASLATLNAEIAGDPLWSMLVSYQADPTLEYRVGTSNGFEVHTEYGRPDSKRADMTGHMLPLQSFDRRLQWTWDYLRNARMSQIEADVQDAIKDARDLFRVQVLKRLLKRGDDSGAAMGLGSGGYSPGFATAAASTNVDFVPPAFGGTSFDKNHEHYVGHNKSGSYDATVFADIVDELLEHGHVPPFIYLASPSNEASIIASTGFVPVGDPTVRYGALQDIASMSPLYTSSGVKALGSMPNVEIFTVRGMPQHYGFGFKTYGANSQRNPVRIRVNTGGYQIEAIPDPHAGNGNFPLANMMLFTEFGVGVGDRTNGTARYINNATWADGSPS